MTALRLGVLAYEVTAPANFDAYAAKLDGLVAEGAAGGADLLVMPEYACMELAAADLGAGDVVRELATVCAQRAALLALFGTLARDHRIWLLPGSMPWAEAGRVRNRAPLIAPDGSMRFQDKSVMTRFEAERWGVVGGAPPCVFDSPLGGRVGIAICYDVEFPPLVQRPGGRRCLADPGAQLHGQPARLQPGAAERAGQGAGKPVFRGRGPHGRPGAQALPRWTRTTATPPCSVPVDRGFAADGDRCPRRCWMRRAGCLPIWTGRVSRRSAPTAPCATTATFRSDRHTGRGRPKRGSHERRGPDPTPTTPPSTPAISTAWWRC